jgi:hypothetical protein
MKKRRIMNKKNNLGFQETEEKQLNYFWDITYGGKEEEIEEVHMSKNVVTTRSTRKNTSKANISMGKSQNSRKFHYSKQSPSRNKCKDTSSSKDTSR